MPFPQVVSLLRRPTPGLTLTAVALVLGGSLAGCTTTTAQHPVAQQLAFTAFSETIAADMYAALAGTEQSQPLVEALSGLAPTGTVFAYADNVNINMPVVPADPSLDAYTRLQTVLQSAGLQARRIGAVTFIEHAPAAPVAPAAVAATAPAAEPVVAPVVPPSESPVVQNEVVLASSAASEPTPVMPQAEEAVSSMPAASAPEPVVLAPAPQKPAPEPVVVDTAVTKIAPAAAPVVAAEPVPAPTAPVDPAPAAAAAVNEEAIHFGTDKVGIANPGNETSVISPDSWHAERGQTLNTVLQGWCERANVQLVWNTDFDYPLAASVTLNDTFENAVRTLLTGFVAVSPQPVARLHRQGNAGQRVLIVETRGNLYQDQ